MKLQYSQSGFAGSVCAIEPANSLVGEPPRRPGVLAMETVVVALVALAAIKALNVQRALNVRWILIPGIQVAAALIPTWIARRDFPRIGLHLQDAKTALKAVGLVSLIVLPPVFLGLWLLGHVGLSIPLRPTLGQRNDWISWLFYQFLYVAVAEEVFFRGYIQANVMRLFAGQRWASTRVRNGMVLLISAACFALAHVAVQGRAVSLLTFLPGLLLAWLFIRTRSLLASIVFHGLANVAYGLMTLALA